MKLNVAYVGGLNLNGQSILAMDEFELDRDSEGWAKAMDVIMQYHCQALSDSRLKGASSFFD